MAAVLYTTATGFQIHRSSYSMRTDFSKCRRYFKLKRRDGYIERKNTAAQQFGIAIETAAKYHHENGLTGGVEKFVEFWNTMQDKALTYTGDDVSWERLLRVGTEMMRLYAIIVPTWPMQNVRFQLSLRKEIFSSTSELAGLENGAYIDALSLPPSDHLMLAKMENPPSERPLITDYKATGSYINPDLVGLDPQLREYAWQFSNPDVAMAIFLKCGFTIEKGSIVRTLEPVFGLEPGTMCWVLLKDSETGDIHAVTSKELFDAYAKSVKGITGNALKKAKATFIDFNPTVVLREEFVTRQRVYFGAARISDEDMKETGRGIGQATLEMIRAEETGFYPKEGGIRFPDTKCTFCAMRGLCLNNDALRDELVTKAGEEWLENPDADSGE